MDYPKCQKLSIPIGSGVTEAACEAVARQRLSQSGMKWHIISAEEKLVLRRLVYTPGRWTQFWNHMTPKMATLCYIKVVPVKVNRSSLTRCPKFMKYLHFFQSSEF